MQQTYVLLLSPWFSELLMSFDSQYCSYFRWCLFTHLSRGRYEDRNRSRGSLRITKIVSITCVLFERNCEPVELSVSSEFKTDNTFFHCFVPLFSITHMETFGLELCAICHGPCNPSDVLLAGRISKHGSEPPMLCIEHAHGWWLLYYLYLCRCVLCELYSEVIYTPKPSLGPLSILF